MRRPYFIGVALLAGSIMWSCLPDKGIEKQIAERSIEVSIERFDQEYLDTNQPVEKLVKKYPYFFVTEDSLSFWEEDRRDSLSQLAGKEIRGVFPDWTHIEGGIKLLYGHFQYYFPDFNPPRTITLLSNIDYDNKVIYADSLMLIALDNYLGENSRLYEGIPFYKRKRMDKIFLLSDVAHAFVNTKIGPPHLRTFLAQMIHEGKRLYLISKMLPSTELEVVMGYSKEEWKWALDNESSIWRYMVENELLYSTELDLPRRFLWDAPFSKFYLEIDQESPGRMGQWIGWRIVMSFMEHNDVNLPQLINYSEDKLFSESQYRPL